MAALALYSCFGCAASSGVAQQGLGGCLGYHAAVSARESHIACMPVAPHCAGKGLTKKAGGAMLVLQKRGACRCRLRGGGKRPDPEPDADNAAVGGEHAQCVCWVHRRVYLFFGSFCAPPGTPGEAKGERPGLLFHNGRSFEQRGSPCFGLRGQNRLPTACFRLGRCALPGGGCRLLLRPSLSGFELTRQRGARGQAVYACFFRRFCRERESDCL